MAARSEMSTGSTIMAFVVGSLAGVAAGMLLAPKSGKESRELIKQKTKEGMDKTRDKMSQGKEAAKEKASRAVDTAKTVATESKEAAKDARDRVKAQTS